MLIWYITCGIVFVCFITITIMFLISDKQNKRLKENFGKDESANDDVNGFKCDFKQTDEGYYFEITSSDGTLLGKSTTYRSKSTCINSAVKFQSRFNLEIIEDTEKLTFGKYSILLDKNNHGKYRFKILSSNALSFVSRYYATKEELLKDIEEYKTVKHNKFLIFTDNWEITKLT